MRLLIAVVLAGAGVLLLRAYVQPELLEVERIRAEQHVVEETISQAREVIRLRDTLLARYNSISAADIEKIRKFLPAGSALSNFLIEVDTLVQDADIEMKDIAFTELAISESADELGLQTLEVTLDIEGTYEDFRDLLSLVERNLRLIDVVGISLQPSEENNSLMNFTLTLNTYYQDRSIL